MPNIGDITKGKNIGKRGGTGGSLNFMYCACSSCGETRWVRLHRGEPRSTRCKKCTQGNGPKHSCWKGGRRVERGYYLVWIPEDHPYSIMRRRNGRMGDYRVFEHRLVMAMHVGRPLKENEVVHHRDGNKLNNDISNLELTTPGKHIVDHGIGYKEGYAKGMEEGYKAGMEIAMRSIKVA